MRLRPSYAASRGRATCLAATLLGALAFGAIVIVTPIAGPAAGAGLAGENRTREAGAPITYSVYLPAVLDAIGGSSTTVTPNTGGTLTTADGQTTVSVPGGAVGSATRVAVSATSAEPPNSVSDVGHVVEITAVDSTGQAVKTLSQPATIELSYAKLNLAAASPNDLAIYSRGDDGTWERLDTTVDTSRQVARATTTHFSLFGLFASTRELGSTNGMAVDGAGNVYAFETYDTESLIRITPGGNVERIYNYKSQLGNFERATDIAIDRSTGALYFIHGTNVYRLAGSTAVKVYQGTQAPQGLDFNQTTGTLLIAFQGVVLEWDLQKAQQVREIEMGIAFSPYDGVRDVVADARGRIFVITSDRSANTSRGTVSGWGNVYFFDDAASAKRWQIVGYGFAGSRLAADDAGNVYVLNEGAISVIAGDPPMVTGFIRNVRLKKGIAVVGGTIYLTGQVGPVPSSRGDRVFTLPARRRDSLGPITATMTPDGMLSGKGSVVTVTSSALEAIPAHHSLQIGDTRIREVTYYDGTNIRFQIPSVTSEGRAPVPSPSMEASRLSVAPTVAHLVAGATDVALGPVAAPDRGQWRYGGHGDNSISCEQTNPMPFTLNEWIVWSQDHDFALDGVESAEGLFPRWSTTSGGRWLAYQFKQFGKFSFVIRQSNGATSTCYVEVKRVVSGAWTTHVVDPARGGSFTNRGPDLNVPAGALPGSSPYTITIGTSAVFTVGAENRPVTAFQSNIFFTPEPPRLNGDVTFRIPYDPQQFTKPPKGAYFDQTLGELVEIESEVDAAAGWMTIRLPAGIYTSTTSASAASQPGPVRTAADKPGFFSKIRGGVNTVLANVWWVAGIPNEQVYDDHFAVLYSTRDGVSEAYAQQLLDALATSYGYFQGKGWTMPSSRVYVKIAPLLTSATGSYGFVPGIGTLTNWYMFFRNGLSTDDLQTTAAHEFFHLIQRENMAASARFLTAGNWWIEGTATWAEYAVFGSTSFSMRMNAGGDFPFVALNQWDDFSGDRAYATAAFVISLEQQRPGTVRDVFGRLGLTTNVYQALQAATGDLPAVYERFARDYWSRTAAPFNAYDLITHTTQVKLTQAENGIFTTGNMPQLSSRLVMAYPGSGSAMPVSFSEASGSAVRQVLGCTGSRIYPLDASRAAIAGREFIGDYSSLGEQFSQPFEKLSTYSIRNPVYFLILNVGTTGDCPIQFIWETPTITSVSGQWERYGPYPTQYVLTISGAGFGPKKGSVFLGLSGESPASWTSSQVTWVRPYKADEPIQLPVIRITHAAGPMSNSMSSSIPKP